MREAGTELKKFIYKNLAVTFTKSLAAYDGRQGNVAIKGLKNNKIIKM